MKHHLDSKNLMIPSERQKNKFAHMIPADQEKTSTPHFDLGIVEMVVKKWDMLINTKYNKEDPHLVIAMATMPRQ